MPTVTAGDLIRAGLRRADMVDSPTGFIQHPASGGGEAFDLLNASVSELTEILYEAGESAYSGAKGQLLTEDGVSDYALTTYGFSGLYRLYGVDYYDGSRWVELKRVQRRERNDYPLPGRPQGYALLGSNLVIYPTPNAVCSLMVRYASFSLSNTIDDDTDTVEVSGPWREFLEIHFAIQCLEKEESDTTALMRRLYGPQMDGNGGLAQRIRNAAKLRDSSQPTRPADVMGDDGAGGDLPPFAVWTR